MAIELEVRSKSQQALGELSAIDTALAKISKRVSGVDDELTKLRADRVARELGTVSSKMNSIGTSKADKTLESTARAASSAASALQRINGNSLTTTSRDAAILDTSIGRLNSNFSNFTKQDAGLRKINDNLASINKSAVSTSSAIKGLSIAAAGIGSAFAAGGMLQFADSITNLYTKINLVTSSTQEASKALSDITDIAFGTRTSLDGTASLYNRISKNSKALQASQKEVAIVTQTVAKAIATSGSSAQEAEAAIMQFGQALASGRLQGDELRSITENASGLSGAIADGLGVTIGRLREMGEAGELSATKVFNALLKQSGEVNAAFSKTGITFAQAFTNMSNSVKLLGMSLGRIFTGLDIPKLINSWAVEIGRFAKTVDWKFNLLSLRASILFENIKSGFSSITIDAIKLNLENFLPSFSTVTGYFDKFTKAIAGMFSWLYDVVIGNSYWTSMIESISSTAQELLGRPLSFVKKFASNVSEAFYGSSMEIGRMTKEMSAYFKSKKNYEAESGAVDAASQDYKGYVSGKYLDHSGDEGMFDQIAQRNSIKYLDASRPGNTNPRIGSMDRLDVYLKRALDQKESIKSQPQSEENIKLLSSIDTDLKVLQSAMVKEVNRMYWVQSLQLDAYREQQDILNATSESLDEIMAKGLNDSNRAEFSRLGAKLNDAMVAQNKIQQDYIKAQGKSNPIIIDHETRKAAEQKALSDQGKSAFSFGSIDVRQHFKGFETVAKVVNWFVTTINDAFKWLYNEVIGNSWWPDLITGIQTWAGALLGVPLGFVIKFIGLVLDGFKTLALTAFDLFDNLRLNLINIFGKGSFLEDIKMILNYFKQLTANVNSLETALKSVKTLGHDFAGLFNAPANKKPLSGANVGNKVSTGPMTASLNKLFNPLIAKLNAVLTPIEAFFQPFSIAFKQSAGMKNNTPGVIPGQQYLGSVVAVDTDAKVGSGPQRNSSTRMIGHDFINALPENAQVPVYAAISAGLILLVNKLFGGFVPTDILTQITTTIAGVVGANIINDSTIKIAQNKISGWIIDTIDFISGFLFGDMKKGLSSMKDPLSIITILGKLSLVFENTRKVLLDTIANIAKSFPAGGAALAGYGVSRIADAGVLKIQETQLANLTPRNQAAQALAAQTQATHAGMVQGQQAGAVLPQQVADAARAMNDAAKAAANLAARHATLTTSIDTLRTRMGNAATAFAESARQARAATAQGLANAGGAGGGVYGFAAGEQLAAKYNLEGTNKLALQVGTAAIGAAIGGALVATITSALGGIMTAFGALIMPMFAPILTTFGVAITGAFAVAAAAIGVPIAAAVALFVAAAATVAAIIWNWDEIWPAIKGIANIIYEGFTSAWKWVSDKFNETIAFVKRVFNAGFPEGLFIFMDKFSEVADSFWKAAAQFFTIANFKALGQALWDGVVGAIKSIGGWMSEKLTGAGKAISSAVDKAISFVVPNAAASENPNFGKSVTNPYLEKPAQNIATQLEANKEEVKQATIKLTDGVNGMVAGLSEQQRLLTFLEVLMKSEHSKSDAESGKAFNRIVGYGGYFSDESAHPNKVGFKDKLNRTSTAAGAFQITNSTFKGFADKVPDFSAQSQTEVATALIQRAGALDDVLAGRFEQAIDKLKKVWTSLPGNTDFTQSQRQWDTVKPFIQDAATNVVNGTSVIQQKLGEGVDSLTVVAKGTPAAISKAYNATKEKASSIKQNISENIDNYTGVGKTTVPTGSTVPIATIKAKVENAITLMDSMSELNKALSDASLPTLTQADFDKLLETPEIFDLVTTSLTAIADATDKMGTASEFNKNKMQKDIEKVKKSIKDTFATAEVGGQEKSILPTTFGKTFSDSIAKEFNENLTNVMTGKIKAKDAFKSMWESLSNQFLQQMTASFMNNLLKGFYSMIETFVGTMDAKFQQGGTDLAKSLMSAFGLGDTKKDTAVTDIDKVISGGGSILKSLMGSTSSTYGTNSGSQQTAMLAAQDAMLSDTTSFFGSLSGSFSDGFATILKGASDFGTSILDFFQGIDIGKMMSAIGSAMSEAFDWVASAVKAIFKFIMSMFADGGQVQGFAGGGKISGPGTGRSDSILAFGPKRPLRVSNGEYIVNAKATAKNKSLLDAINFGQADFGQIPAFAGGGYITQGFSALSKSMKAEGGNPLQQSSNTSVTNNISITGDISRQTRQEIQRMIPQITAGVNSTNIENNYRR